MFHPRQQRWTDHFALAEAVIVGLTPCGRATVSLLRMNEHDRVELRALLIAAGEF